MLCHTVWPNTVRAVGQRSHCYSPLRISFFCTLVEHFKEWRKKSLPGSRCSRSFSIWSIMQEEEVYKGLYMKFQALHNEKWMKSERCYHKAQLLKITVPFSTSFNIVKSFSASLRITLLPNGTLKITNVTRRDAGSYTCIAKNQFGTASTTGRLLITGESYSYRWQLSLLAFLPILFKSAIHHENIWVHDLNQTRQNHLGPVEITSLSSDYLK